ncbi:MAG TPA: sulfatase-like hydrolase/transferase [Vicinamibacterales bacterium]|nr:sulfatase-like hydrolase/transferase [Vicinamibacterales bacterium]
MGKSRAIAAVLLITLAAGSVAWWAGRREHGTSSAGLDLGQLPRGVRQQDLNVLVITLDTMRWDRLGAYGDRGAQTPNLDRLAAEGVLFEEAITSAPLTLPAHSTLFTGLLPPRHGVRDNGGYVLDPKHATLAHILKNGGWDTGAFIGAFVLDGKFGLDQGFDTYHDRFDVSKYQSVSLSDVARTGGEVVDTALPWLEARAGKRFFAWLHFYDAHSPYNPPEPFKSRFPRQPYAGEIAYVDSQVGRVLQWLDTTGLKERTIVIAVGDHGESLNEHREGTHGLFIYDATTRVPFIVRAPFAGMQGRRVRTTVRSEDVMPTLLDMIGRAGPAAMQGRSLVPLLTGAVDDLELDAYTESLYAFNHYGWSELKALRAGRFKYIATTRPELYDLERDPGELTNLYSERRSLADRMAAELERLAVEEEQAQTGPSAVDPETRERLAALGYIGSFSNVVRKPGEQLPDPKDKIDIFNLMTSAQEATGKENSESTIDRLRRVVSMDPNILDAWVMLGNEYFRKQNPQAALEQYKRALQIRPDYDLATVNLAAAYRALGDYEAALLGYERYLQKDPKNAWVRYQMGEMFVDLNQLDKAEEAFKQSLIDDTRVAVARNALGVVALKRGDVAGAEREIRAALAQKPDVKLAHFNLALVAEQRGDLPTAIREYQTEIDTQQNAFKAAFNLGKLHEQMGNAAGQEAAYRKAIELNPNFSEGYFYLAKLYLDQGRNYEEAITIVKRGIALGSTSTFAPLGHYVLADLYSRTGRPADAQREAERGRALEAARSRRATN